MPSVESLYFFSDNHGSASRGTDSTPYPLPRNLLNIDFCEPLIKAMERNYGGRPGLEWKVCTRATLGRMVMGAA